jgi:two-component system sensor histidine kinase KdpD
MKGADARPDPDALLAAVRRENRGRLRIFLGAAPGVGKTYAMLSGAARLAREKQDVVVGIVETHGRAETEALVAGLEVLPRRIAVHRGTQLSEFDLDAALERRPALLIVDELAHTNAPDSRHPKRYLDVLELIDSGIDVWTAMNIQHLEGLSDVVSRITGVTIRETVPDRILDEADEVVVVDITPAELITRLQDGKIYLPDNARRAADGFFRPGNLTALRELALRRTADRVDDQMVDHLRRHAIEGAWPTAERILVCVGPDASSQTVVRAASRLASGLNAPWTAVTLEGSGRNLDATEQRRIDEALSLAERLGAETARLSGRDLVEEIIRYARRENMTQIVIGRSHAGFWARLRGRSLPDVLVQRVSDIAVHVVVGDMPAPRRRWSAFRRDGLGLGLVTAGVSVAAAVGVGEIATHYVQLPNLSMLFLAAVLICAVSFGVWSAIAAALLSFVAYNFFFIPPIYTLTVAEPHELLALLIFLLVAVLTGGLAGRVRDQSNAAYKRIATIQALYDMSRKLSGTTSLDDVLWVLARQAAAAVKGQVVILLASDDADQGHDLSIRAAFPPEDQLAPGEWAAARWAYQKGEVAGWRTGTLPTARFRFMPARTSSGIVGVVGFEPADRTADMSSEDERAVAALVDQGSISIERALLVTDAQRNEALAERERLQSTLLSSLSHDLRTPLASILGAATSLRNYGESMPAGDRDDLLATVEEEASRLARFVSNLLDMTRIESGTLSRHLDWLDISDVVSNAVKHARKAFPARRIDVAVAENLPPVRGEPILLEQALFNLLDNADKYADAGTPTIVRAIVKDGAIVMTVEDRGQGIPPVDRERVFEKFTRLDHGDGRRAGTGLGLAIARGVIDALGGTIHAESPAQDGRGSRIVIRIPASRPDDPLLLFDQEEARAGISANSRH